MSKKFEFHGQTTFINRPRDTVIRDFQNNYQSANDPEKDRVINELSQLLRLVLESQKMPDHEKENVAQAIDSLASQAAKEEEVSKLTFKGTLEAIKEIVSRASDVAVPALAIIQTLMTLLKLAT